MRSNVWRRCHLFVGLLAELPWNWKLTIGLLLNFLGELPLLWDHALFPCNDTHPVLRKISIRWPFYNMGGDRMDQSFICTVRLKEQGQPGLLVSRGIWMFITFLRITVPHKLTVAVQFNLNFCCKVILIFKL